MEPSRAEFSIDVRYEFWRQKLQNKSQIMGNTQYTIHSVYSTQCARSVHAMYMNWTASHARRRGRPGESEKTDRERVPVRWQQAGSRVREDDEELRVHSVCTSAHCYCTV